MGWQDRDYLDEGYEGRTSLWPGIRRPPAATLTLMVLHGAAYLLLVSLWFATGHWFSSTLALQGELNEARGILLHPFATTSILTALFTILALWSLGGRLENRLGIGRLLAVYVLGNLLAGASFYAFARWQPSLALLPLDYPVGALTAMVVIAWNELRHEPTQVFGRITSLAKVYLVCAGLVVLIALVSSGEHAFAWLVALFVGALAAPLVEHGPRLSLPRHRRRRMRPSIARTPPPDEYDIDDILAKISRSGMGSLTRREVRRLEAARQAKLQRSQMREQERHSLR